MSEEVPDTTENPADATPVARAPWRKRLWKWIAIGIVVVVVAPALLFTIWSGIALKWAYSTGDRAGYVQKFSRKGWVCKTWEGELLLSMLNVPGATPERFLFTVRDDSIAKVITDHMGKRVSLHYEEHLGVPSTCFGDTRYYVTGIRELQGP